MKRLLLAVLSLFVIADSYSKDNAVELFPLSDVRITDGEMLNLQELSHKYMLTLEPDRLLSWFRREAGLTPKAQPYPLWESEDICGMGPLPGHIMGFYLSGMSMMYQSTGDPAILDRLRYTVSGLQEAQDANGDGYLLPTRIGKHVFEDVVDGNFVTSNSHINDTWEPVYVMNKIMLGLYDAFTLCGIEEAKPVMVKMADWFGFNVLDRITHDAIQKLLVCEHGSINECYADVYLLTKDEKYLRWAGMLNHEDLWIPLSEGRDILKGKHANTQIPKFTGFISVGRNNGDQRLLNAAELFWDIVIGNHTWITGGNSYGEQFFAEDAYIEKVRSKGGSEFCNSVNMMRLTEALYQLDGNVKRIDYYERVLYNHILGNFDPEVGMSCYFTSMRPGQYKIFADPYNCFWCCVGTGLQAPAKLGKMVYAHKDDTLFVNMFTSSSLQWKERNFNIEQKTRYPDENRSSVTVNSKGDLKIAVRIPWWTDEFSACVKCDPSFAGERTKAGNYIVFDRKWKPGDEIEITFTPRLEVKPLKKFDQYMSIQYGAYVMAAKIDNHGLTHDDFIRPDEFGNTPAMKTIPESEVPFLVGSADDIMKSIAKADTRELRLVYSGPKDTVELIPFFRILMDRYEVYFPHYGSLAEYNKAKKGYYSPSDEQEEYFSRSEIDRVRIGDDVSERAHKMESYRSRTGDSFDQMWRQASDGGFFMYEMECSPDKPMKLAVRYRQDDSGNRIFDVQVDGRTIRTTDHSTAIAGVDQPLYYEEIEIPASLTEGKRHITVKFNAHNHCTAGAVFDLRTLEN